MLDNIINTNEIEGGEFTLDVSAGTGREFINRRELMALIGHDPIEVTIENVEGLFEEGEYNKLGQVRLTLRLPELNNRIYHHGFYIQPQIAQTLKTKVSYLKWKGGETLNNIFPFFIQNNNTQFIAKFVKDEIVNIEKYQLTKALSAPFYTQKWVADEFGNEVPTQIVKSNLTLDNFKGVLNNITTLFNFIKGSGVKVYFEIRKPKPRADNKPVLPQFSKSILTFR